MWDIDRVMSKVSHEDGCWIWLGAFNTDGYPRMSEVIEGKNYQNIKGHIRVYELFNGEIPEGHVIRHTCDNIKCINPSHLITGTPSDNMSDRRERGRTSNHVSDEIVSKIYKLRQEGLSQLEVSKIVGCSQTHVSKRERRTYKHLEE